MEEVLMHSFLTRQAMDKGYLITQDHASKAHGLMRELSVLCDDVPSSLFIPNISGIEERAISGGAMSDVYKGSYNGKTVALKMLRSFHRGSDLRDFRSVRVLSCNY
jgi:hypothetical protein